MLGGRSADAGRTSRDEHCLGGAGHLLSIPYQRLLDPDGFDLDRVYADLDAVLARGLTSSV